MSNIVGDIILRPGVNCWRRVRADRLAFLIDGKAYFDALADALRAARQRIFILGWDFDSRMRLQPDLRPDTSIAALLLALLDENPALEVRLLLWRNSIWYAGETDPTMLLGGPWLEHPRFKVHLDAEHPVGGAHHEKIVCIDDRLAFLGGIDLTQRRWDDRDHASASSLRRTADGTPYPPVHDLQAMVEGPAAAALCKLACTRWHEAGGEALPALRRDDGGSAWPADIAPDLTRVPVAIARTRAHTERRRAVHEITRLTLDAVAAARQQIYIEAQYFALPDLAELLAERIAAEDGPEVVVVTANEAEGWVENLVMAQSRERLFARLRAGDRHGKLRLRYPCHRTAGKERCDIGVHAKLLMVDDRFLRIGSSNLNQRSTGLDSECDLAIEAADERTRAVFRRLRADLLGEHLSASAEEVEAAIARTGSLGGAIDAFASRERTLAPFPDGPADPDAPALPLAELFDPPGSIDLGRIWRGFGQT